MFSTQVRAEHAALAQAIEAGDPAGARKAAARHLRNAVRRIESADLAFWSQEGERLAKTLVGKLKVGAPPFQVH